MLTNSSNIVTTISGLDPSCLSKFDDIVYPGLLGWSDEHPGDITSMMLFWNHISLLKTLNEELTVNRQNPEDSVKALEDWKSMLPQQLTWCDHASPILDLEHARLRARYYEAHHTVLRHYLDRAMETGTTVEDLQSIVAKYIHSAICSIVASDSVVLRPHGYRVLKNTFGMLQTLVSHRISFLLQLTKCRRFKIVLVLALVCTSIAVSQLCKPWYTYQHFFHLVDKAIRSFEEASTDLPELGMELRVLKKVQIDVWMWWLQRKPLST
jgi:hypothetical protein